MEILIVTPPTGGVATGNRGTAGQWAGVLRGLGHRVEVTDIYGGEAADVLVALHARKCHGVICRSKQDHSGTPVVVALTGTDLYPGLGAEALESLRLADRVVVFQRRAWDRLPPEVRPKSSVIVQSAKPLDPPPARAIDPFVVAVAGHLRAVKDPMRAAEASRLLPPGSRVCVRHAGAVLEPEFRELVAREQRENSRYTWLGELSPDATRQLIASSQALVLSSRSEGGGRVIGEAVVCGTPVLASRNDATLSLLGEDHPGLFDFGDTAALAGLMAKLERDCAFRDDLQARTAERAPQFDPARESAAWRELLGAIAAARTTSQPGSPKPAHPTPWTPATPS
jgi:putative glycosyltransferase (TIGR04348 family)